MTDKNEGWTWCCHHDRELEYCYDFKGRVQYILEQKPESERAIRLREFRFVLHPERLPMELIPLEQNIREARAVWWTSKMTMARTYPPHPDAVAPEKITWERLQGAYDAYIKVESEHAAFINALHREEFPETSWDGKSILSTRCVP